MEIREHHGFGHGLRPGETWDMNCLSCRREDEAARADAIADHQAACERTVAGGRCTLCETESAELVPWSGDRLCMGCVDLQLDLLAKAVQADAPVTVMVTR